MQRKATHAAQLLAIALLTLATVERHAQANIVFESYEVRRPTDADVPIDALLDEFDKLGYVAKPRDVMDQLGSQLARQGRDSKVSARTLLEELGNAHGRWLAAKDSFETLAQVLSRVLTKAFDNPALVVTDKVIRAHLQNVLLDFALVNGKLARDPAYVADAKKLQRASEDAMAEWIRTFSGDEITQTKFGPEAEKLYTRVRDERDKLGRGVLTVTIDDPNVQLYVNEAIRSRLRSITDLVPGRYRVLLMGANDEARLFWVDILANETTRLRVDWTVASSLQASSAFVAFVFASTIHPDAATLACQLGRTTRSGVGKLVLVGTGTVGTKRTLTASIYHVTGCQLDQSAYVVLGKPATARSARALAQFLVKGTRDPDVFVTTERAGDAFAPTGGNPMRATAATVSSSDEPTLEKESSSDALVAPTTRASGATSRGWLKWAAAGSSVVLLAGGGYLVDKGRTLCGLANPGCSSRAYDVGGYAAVGTGVALGALSLYWFFDLTPEQLPTRWLIGGGAAALAVGIGLYAVDQDPDKHEAPTYRDSAPSGMTVGVLGLAAIGVGVWSWTRNTPSSSMPTVSFSSSRAVVGWQGAF